MRNNTREKPYHCCHCDNSFLRDSDLIGHLRIHRGEKPYKCSQDKSFRELYTSFNKTAFSIKRKLGIHMRAHTEEKPYECSHCDKAFAVKLNLDINRRTHIGEKP